MKLLLLFLISALFATNSIAKPVNINTADAQTIADALNGIGIKKAQAIVDYRDKNGQFSSIDELTHVFGIGTKTIEKNRHDILLSDPLPSKEQVSPEESPDSEKPIKNHREYIESFEI